MKNNFFLSLFSFLTFTLLIYIIYWAIFDITDVDKKLTAFGIVGVLLTAIVTIITVSINNKHAREREYEAIALKEKLASYEYFYRALFELFKNKSTVNNNTTNDLLLFKKGLMNWGSENLISKYLIFEEVVIYGNLALKEKIKRTDDLLREIRVEFGYRDSNKIRFLTLILDQEARKQLEY